MLFSLVLQLDHIPSPLLFLLLFLLPCLVRLSFPATHRHASVRPRPRPGAWPRGRGTKAMRRGIVPALAPWLRRPNHLRFTESRHKRSPQFSDRGLHPLVKKSPHPLTRLAFTPCRLHSLSSSLSVVRDASVAQNVLKLLPQKVRVGGVIVRYWWPHRRIVSPAPPAAHNNPECRQSVDRV